jgi:polyphosphate kinase
MDATRTRPTIRPMHGPVPPQPAVDLDDPALYTNRELSWLDFNQRVLDEAHDERNPLLERVRFLAIAANNLDEFFMVRIAGLKRQVSVGVTTRTPDGMSPAEQLEAIRPRTRAMIADFARCLEGVLQPQLADEGLGIRDWASLTAEQRDVLRDVFHDQIYPVLTPLAVDPAHPFPYISNLSLNLAVVIRDPLDGRELFARVKVPQAILGRFVTVPGTAQRLPLEQLVAAHLDMLFPGMEIREFHSFRVTRNADIEIEEDEAEDLMDEIESGLRSVRFQQVVRLTVAPSMPQRLRDLLMRELAVDPTDVIEQGGLHGIADIAELAEVPDDWRGEDHATLTFPKWTPQTRPSLQESDGVPVDYFALMRDGDFLVHHPYDSFTTSVEAFIAQAVDDPQVLAIKQTLYRTAENSEIMTGLIRAAESGKQVVVVVELKARFDEQRNIRWARRLEASGAHVAYGLVGLKTHCKSVLVVRREADGIRRYVHLGTGNYNASTARVYEDIGLFSCRPELGADLSDLFNLLTGYSRQREFRRLHVAPNGIRSALVHRIRREIDHARAGRPARIVLKMNSLVDAGLIRTLYEASQAGVRIDLIVRGIVCLVPGVPGVSDNIRVRSIIGRFLEHSRVYWFHNDGDDEFLIGSADLMPRNLDRRIESLTPVIPAELRAELREALEIELVDNRQARELGADGRWVRVYPAPGEPERATHAIMTATAVERSRT